MGFGATGHTWTAERPILGLDENKTPGRATASAERPQLKSMQSAKQHPVRMMM
jgi:hypothetical protein